MRVRPLIVAAVLLLSPAAATAQHTWLGPYGSPSPWRHADWIGGVPPTGGGTALTVDFPYPYGSPGVFTLSTFDRGAFVFNRFTFSSPGGQITLAADGTTPGNSLIVGGADPRIVQDGLGPVRFENGGPATNTFGGVTVSGTGLGQVVFGSALAGTGGITIDYAQSRPTSGRVVLQAPTSTNPNNFTGDVTLNAGNLTLGSHGSALGNVANTLVVNGGTIGVQPVTTTQIVVANPVTLNADLIFTGAADPNAAQTLTLTNAIAQGSGIRHVEVRGVNGNDSFGAGTLILQGANTYSGNTVVGFSPHYESYGLGTGGITFSGAGGSALNSPEFSIADGGALTLDSAAAGNHSSNNRLHDAARVALHGGHFRLDGAASAATSEFIGPLDIAGGSSVTVNASASGNLGTAAHFSTLARVGRSAVLFRGNNPSLGGAPGAGTANVTFGAAPSLVGGGGAAGTTTVSILPYAYAATTLSGTAASGTELVTYGPNGIRPLAAAEYATTLPSGVTAQNVKLSTSTAFTGPATINALVLDADASFTTGSTGTLTVNSGTVLVSNSTTIGPNIGIDFAGTEGHIIVTGSSSTTLIMNGVVSGTNGLTKSGPGTVRLANSSNTITGPAGLTINEGTVEFRTMFNFGTLAGVTVNGKTGANPPGFFHSGPSAADFGLPVTVNGGFVRFDALNQTLTVSSRIQGTGGVVIDSTADVRLTATNNSYGGTTRVHAGRLIISSDANLGNSPALVLVTGVTGSAASLRLEGDWTTARTLRIAESTATTDFASLDTNGFNATISGPLVGGGVLRKSGAGRLTLTQPTDFGQGISSNIVVVGGELRVMNATGSATGFAHVQVLNGATVSGTGRIAATLSMLDGSTLAPGADGIGTLRVDSNVGILGRFLVDVDATTSDRLSLSSQLQINPTSTLEINGTLAPGVTYTLADYSSLAANQTFGSIVGLPSSHTLVISPTTMQLVPVPEPTSILALSAVAVATGRLIRLRSRRRSPNLRSSAILTS
jgi:autotransporter-associated beta strand protein